MDTPSEDRVTELLNRMSSGDRSASGELTAVLYRELYRRACHLMRHQHAGHTLQATALVRRTSTPTGEMPC